MLVIVLLGDSWCDLRSGEVLTHARVIQYLVIGLLGLVHVVLRGCLRRIRVQKVDWCERQEHHAILISEHFIILLSLMMLFFSS